MEIDWLRLLSSFEAGALLSLTGSLVQGVTQNELAGPSTLGFDALIVLFVLLSQGLLVLFPTSFLSLELETMSVSLFLSCLAVVTLFLFLKSKKRSSKNKDKNIQDILRSHDQSLSFFILLGLCFNLFVGMIFSIMQFLFMAQNWQFPTQLWYGQFRFVSMNHLMILSTIFSVCYISVTMMAKKLWAISFGTEFCLGLGLDIHQLQQRSLLLSLLGMGTVTSFFGVFSFMGLIFPHILRSLAFFRYNFKRELLWGPFLGGFLMMILDFCCASFSWRGAEIPVGMISGIIGSFFLMFILIKKKKNFFK